MTISLKHSKTSTVPDSGDTTLVQPSDWNSEHTLSCASGKIIGRSTTGVGNAEEITIGAGLSLSGGELSATDAGGTVTSVSVVTANGLAGSVANQTTTPAITLSTTVTGLLKGNGTAISAASSGTDYAPATSGTAILKGNGSGGFANASAGTDYVSPSVLGAANGVATLGSDSKLTSSQIPDISIVTYLGVVASQSAMLALTGQQGDWCTRSDLGTNWIITGANPALLASWTQLSYPTAPVTSVNTQTGAVVLSAANVGAQPAITVNGIIKGNGSGTLSAATSGTDYAPATSGTSILKGNGSGGFSNASAGTDYAAANASFTLGSTSVSLGGTTSTLAGLTLTNPTINGFTGNTSIVNIGSGQFYKDTSGNVGIGTSSPANKVHISGDGSASLLKVQATNTNGTASINLVPNGTGNGQIYTESGALLFSPANTERMRLDSAGNLGLGVTPSAWGSTFKALQEGAGSLWSYSTSGFGFTANAYNNSGWKYVNNGYANSFETDTGKFIWYNAASGTAGNAISFTQAMTLDASGNLLVGNTAFSYGGKTLSYATSAYNTNTYNPLELGSASGATVNHQLQKTTVSTTATVILSTGLYASLVVIFGSDGTNRFIDLVLFGLGNGAAGVVSSFSVSGTPAARTYSQSSSTYRLAMASGTYTVQAYAMSMSG